MLVSKRHEDDSLVHERAQARNDGALLTAALSARGYEHARILAVVSASRPLLACLVPKDFPLGREVAESSGRDMLGLQIPYEEQRDVPRGDAEEEGVKRLELRGVGQDLNVRGLGRCMHFGENFVGEGLFDSVVELAFLMVRDT